MVFALVGSTMIYSSSKIKKENIIDVLKKKIYKSASVHPPGLDL